MRWSNEQRAFAVEAYFSKGGSVVSTQRAFRNRFNIAPLGPDCHMTAVVNAVLNLQVP
jgi:hypothetical protein